MINIVNNGPELVSTNYWDTKFGSSHFAFGANAGTMRLLLSTNLEGDIYGMLEGCDYVVVSTIPDPAERNLSIEFLFEDHSNSPFVLHSCAGAALGLFPKADPTPVERPLTLWVKGPRKVATLRAFIRRVPRLPWLKPLRFR